MTRRTGPGSPNGGGKRMDVDVWEAAALLEANWRTYAESFDDLHRE